MSAIGLKQQRAIEEAQAALDISCQYKLCICVGLTVVLGLIMAAVVYMGYFWPRILRAEEEEQENNEEGEQ